MFSKLGNYLMNSVSNAALKAAVHSCESASHRGMYQMKEPENLQKAADEYKASLKRAK